MSKRPTAYYRPEDIAAAWGLLSKPDVVPLAGGTKLLAGPITSAVVDLQALGLNQIRLSATHLLVGATAKLVDVAAFLANHSPELAIAPLLQKAIQQAGPNTYRHAATLGGSIASRLPDSELLAALLVLAAEVTLYRGEATAVSVADYLAAAERPLGLLTQIAIPLAAGQGHSERVARTPADYPIVSVTLWLPENGTPCLAATGIDERPLRLSQAEAALIPEINATSREAAAQAAHQSCHHPGDFRGSTAYRADMAAVLTRRILQLP